MINIVLYRPQKPLNTGNIMRTSMVSDSMLHIIGPLTFTIDDKQLKRAGLDYLSKVSYKYYESYEEFLKQNENAEIFYITRYGKTPHSSIDFTNKEKNYFVMFGSESAGIPLSVLKENKNNCYRIPMRSDARSLNLSNCVAIVVYEALRQQDYNELAKTEIIKGEDFLINS